jgi:hypothetical protein
MPMDAEFTLLSQLLSCSCLFKFLSPILLGRLMSLSFADLTNQYLLIEEVLLISLKERKMVAELSGVRYA